MNSDPAPDRAASAANASPAPTALIADDEPLLRERLAAHLNRLWPELRILAQARNGREAIELFDEHQPELVFLDVHMPGLNGVEVARALQGETLIVFVTAYEKYALQAFEQGAVDYLVKPFDEARLLACIERMKLRVQERRAAKAGAGIAMADLTPLLDQLSAAAMRSQGQQKSALQWIKASVGPAVKLIAVGEVIYLKSDEKYTLVVWSGGEALIRKPIRELADELDAAQFVQVHRSVIVNLRCVAQVVRGANETAELHLRGRTELLPVSRSYLHHFRQM